MKEIKLTRGAVTIIDDEDYCTVSQFKWHATSKGYAVRRLPKKDGEKTVLLHRAILRADPKSVVDHIDGNPLNNQRCNLRICAAIDNSRNRKASKNNTTGFKGVSATPSNNWIAQITVEYKNINLGRFDTPEEAARHYNLAAKKYYGEFAKLNPVEPTFPQKNRNEVSTRNTSGYKGVSWFKRDKKWIAQIMVDGKTRQLGKFLDPKDASDAYQKALKEKR